MEGTVNKWKASKNVTGAVVSLVQDTAEPTNHVLRYDGSKITKGDYSYVAYSDVLEVGKEYYFSYKIRMAECDTNTGNLYAYNQNHTATNEKDRPKLSKEWVSRSGVFKAVATSYNFKITSTVTSSSSNVKNAVYELDDIVICDVPFGDVLALSEESNLNGTELSWKSGVINLNGDLYARADSMASFALNADSYTKITAVEVNGEIITPDGEGVYEIYIPDDLQLTVNVDIETDNVPKLLSVTPENVANADPKDMVVTATFDREMDIDSFNDENIIVSPQAAFEVVDEGDNTYSIVFNELAEATEYTVQFTNNLLAYETGVAMEEGHTYTFTTASEVVNIIENGDMSDTLSLAMYSDNGNGGISYADIDGNSVLKWKVTFNNAPLFQYINKEDGRNETYNFVGGHTYYVKARVKSDADTKMRWETIYYTDTDKTTNRHNKKEVNVAADKWTTVENYFTIPANVITDGNQGIRLGADKATVYVDDIELIDCSVTPGGRGEMVSSYPENGETEVEVGNGETQMSLTFNRPLLPTTVKTSNITADGATIEAINLSADKKTCILNLSQLQVNKTVTINYKELLTMVEEEVEDGSVSFETETMSTATPLMVKSSPFNGENTKLNGLNNMEIVYDLPLASGIDKSSFVTNPENLIESVEWSYDKSETINIKLNKECLVAGNSYSVTVLSTVKSKASTPVNEQTITFSIITKDEVVQVFKDTLSDTSGADTEDVLKFITDYYSDLAPNDTLCESMIEKDSMVAEKFADQILDNGIKADADIDDVIALIHSSAVLAILNNSENEELIADAVNSVLVSENMTSLSEIYKDLSDDVKANICSDIKKLTKDFKTISEIVDYLEDRIIFTAMQNVSGWQAISDVLNGNIEFFSSETKTLINKINNSTDKAEIYLKLQGKNASSEAEIYNILKAAYDNSLKKQNTKPSGGGGGGGGGGRVTSVTTVNAVQSPTQNVEEPLVFKDIDSVPWAKEAIEHFYELKVVSGKTSDTFCPNDFVKREEFIKMIVIAADVSMTEKKYTYSDVDSNEWYYQYVLAATESKLVQGIDETNFGIGQNITRQDIATICNRLLGANDEETEETSEGVIADYNEVSDYAKEAVNRLVSLEIIQGDENGNFAPRKYATRAETVVLLQRLIAFMNSEGR